MQPEELRKSALGLGVAGALGAFAQVCVVIWAAVQVGIAGHQFADDMGTAMESSPGASGGAQLVAMLGSWAAALGLVAFAIVLLVLVAWAAFLTLAFVASALGRPVSLVFAAACNLVAAVVWGAIVWAAYGPHFEAGSLAVVIGTFAAAVFSSVACAAAAGMRRYAASVETARERPAPITVLRPDSTSWPS